MLRHGWSAFCERAIIDQENKNINLINCFEVITSSTLPTFVPNLYLVSYWYKDDIENKEPIELKLKYSFQQPSGEKILLGENNIEVNTHRQKVINQVVGLLLPREGRYYIIFEKMDNDWIEIARLPLTLIYNPPTAEGAEKIEQS